MKAKLRGVPKQSQKRESFIQVRGASKSVSLVDRMGPEGGSGHLRDDQIDRAQEVVRRLKDQFGSLAELERASGAFGAKLKQQTMSLLLNNRQLGYQVAERIMRFARHVPHFADLPDNYILGGPVEKGGTVRATQYALRPMRYRAKGEFLDALAGALPSEFLDFTAGRDPVEPDADAWTGVDWLAHVARELELWKYMKSQPKQR